MEKKKRNKDRRKILLMFELKTLFHAVSTCYRQIKPPNRHWHDLIGNVKHGRAVQHPLVVVRVSALYCLSGELTLLATERLC